MSDVEALMKRCRAGTMSYEAANGLHADCYGMLGKLAIENEQLRVENEKLRNIEIIQEGNSIRLVIGGEE